MLVRQDETDDDCPPDLASLPAQVAALKGAGLRPASEANISQAAVSFTQSDRQQQGGTPGPLIAAGRPLRKGFLDAKPLRSLQPSKARPEKPGIQVISAKGKKPNGKDIPKDFIIPPDEHQLRYLETKSKLVDALQPNKETVDSVLANPALLAGFDDPDVMRAVNDIAADPRRLEKYKGQPKVLKFYEQMGSLMATRCEAAANAVKPALT